MIVGDSISAGPGCYKKFLDEKLVQAGIVNYEFVGKYNDDCGGGIAHSAVSCSTTSDYVKDTFVLENTSCSRDTFDGLARLMVAYEPDLLMLQLGVNDIWNADAAIQPVLDNYTALLEQARANNPNIVVVVAQIQKINTQQLATPCTATEFSPKAQELVDAVPAWAAGVSTDASRVYVADLWTNSLVSETKDCVHPTDDAGAIRMADNWFNALAPLLE
jgi:lysophospholipase L1-like esterase